MEKKHFPLNDLLFGRLPQLRDRYAGLLKSWGSEEPGPHVVYEDLLVPFMIEEFSKSIQQDSLKDAFDLLEELLASGDKDARDLIGASVLEALYEDPTSREGARARMGPHTRKLAANIGARWATP